MSLREGEGREEAGREYLKPDARMDPPTMGPCHEEQHSQGSSKAASLPASGTAGTTWDLAEDDGNLVYRLATTLPAAPIPVETVCLWTLCEEERAPLSTWKRHPSGQALSRLAGS